MNPITYLAIATTCFLASLLCEVIRAKEFPRDTNLLRGSGFFLGWGSIAAAMFVVGVADWMMM